MFDVREDFLIDPVPDHVADHDFLFGEEGFDVVEIWGFEGFHWLPSFLGGGDRSKDLLQAP